MVSETIHSLAVNALPMRNPSLSVGRLTENFLFQLRLQSYFSLFNDVCLAA